jgi:transposase, IS6 family
VKTTAASIKSFDVTRMIRKGHRLTCKPHVKDEVRFVDKLLDAFHDRRFLNGILAKMSPIG